MSETMKSVTLPVKKNIDPNAILFRSIKELFVLINSLAECTDTKKLYQTIDGLNGGCEKVHLKMNRNLLN